MDKVQIRYQYRFPEGEEKECLVRLDGGTLILAPPPEEPPPWALLECHRCPECRLDPERAYCPVAANLTAIVTEFGGRSSCDEVEVTVTTEQRVCSKNTHLWEGLSSLIGIIMACSGCPGLDPLRPLVRFHLPFASVEETAFRTLSLALLGSLLRKRNGRADDDPLEAVSGLYASVAGINQSFANRLRAAAERDAHVNALINLDVYAQLVPLTMEEFLDAITPSFGAWLREPENEDAPAAPPLPDAAP